VGKRKARDLHCMVGTSLLLVALAAACTGPLETRAITPGATSLQKLDESYNGLRRTYRLFVPSGYEAEVPTPLVVVIHGGFSNAEEMEARTRWSEVADRENFLVVYPNGIGLFGLTQHWNAGHCCGAARFQRVDDLAVVEEAIAEVSAALNVDRDRIYLTGFSNGAMLTHLYAATHGRQLAAIAPLAGSIGGRPDEGEALVTIPEPVMGLPVIVFHGTDDRKIPYSGGVSEGRRSGVVHTSARDAAELWRRRNGCEATPERSLLFEGRAVLDAWRACEADSEVLLYSIRGWGHRWPGPVMMEGLEAEDPLRALDATEIIWDFFERNPRRAPGPGPGPSYDRVDPEADDG
jgi:polyhydroxybutyrate depolymerase